MTDADSRVPSPPGSPPDKQHPGRVLGTPVPESPASRDTARLAVESALGHSVMMMMAQRTRPWTPVVAMNSVPFATVLSCPCYRPPGGFQAGVSAPRTPPPFQVLRGAGLAVLPTRGNVACVRLSQGPEAHLSFCIWRDGERAFRQGVEGPSVCGAICNTTEQNQREKNPPICACQRQQETLLTVIWLTCSSTAVTHSPCPVYF